MKNLEKELTKIYKRFGETDERIADRIEEKKEALLFENNTTLHLNGDVIVGKVIRIAGKSTEPEKVEKDNRIYFKNNVKNIWLVATEYGTVLIKYTAVCYEPKNNYDYYTEYRDERYEAISLDDINDITDDVDTYCFL